MTAVRLAPGKLPPELLRELLPASSSLPPEILVPPTPGEDGCAISLAGGVLVAATDPITLIGSGAGAHAVLVNANDVAVMGVRPRWFLANVLLPVGTTEDAVRALFDAMRAALDDLGASLVGGHTEVTAAVTQPVVVGAMLGLNESGTCVRTGGARPGDVVLQVGETPVEGAYVLAAEGGAALADVPGEMLARARGAIRDPGISVVDAALLAAELGATALHDPTEGGLATALHELAETAGVALEVDSEAVLWFPPGLAVCEAVGADPWGTLASGALIASFPAEIAASARASLTAAGHAVAAIARAVPGSGVVRSDGSPLPRFPRDELSRVL